MEQARNADTGEVYDAVSFDHRPDRDQLRHTLVCLECGADAYFSRSGRNGRSASFGARPHRPGCQLGAGDSGSKLTANLSETEIRTPLENELQLRRVDDKHTGIHVDHDDDAPRQSNGRARRHTIEGGTRKSLPSRGLRVMLAKLQTEPETRSSTSTLHLFDGTKMPVRDACVHVNDVTEELRNKRRLYWGTIRDARYAKDAYWINTGRSHQPGVKLTTDQMKKLLDRLHLDDADDLAGAGIILFAPLRLVEATGRLLLFPDEHLEELDVLLPSRSR